jgi:hypothetical protein
LEEGFRIRKTSGSIRRTGGTEEFLVHYGIGAAMPEMNPRLLRVALLVLFMIVTQIFRVMAKSKPAQRDRPGSPLEALKEAKRRIEQERARQQQRPQEAELLQPGEQFDQQQFQQPQFQQQDLQQPQFQQPPTVAPESSWFPSLLLLALAVCLCLMAYRLWTGK